MGPADDCDMAILQLKLDCVAALKAEMAAYKAEKEAYLRRAQQPPPDIPQEGSAPAEAGHVPEEPSALPCTSAKADGVPECEACCDELLGQQVHMWCKGACVDPLRSQTATAPPINLAQLAEDDNDEEYSSSSPDPDASQGNPLVMAVETGPVNRCEACRKGLWDNLPTHMYCKNACLPTPTACEPEDPFFKLPPYWSHHQF